MRTVGSPPLRRRCKSEVAGRMQRRCGFAAGFCRRPCRPLSPDMKSYWVTGNKKCKNTRSCAAFLCGHGFWRRNSKAGHAGAFFCEKPPRTRFSERTAVPPSPPWRSPGDTLQKAFYRLLTVKLRFPGGLRGFVAENVPECRLIFLCKNPDLLFLLW